jgi:hypothetical protein
MFNKKPSRHSPMKIFTETVQIRLSLKQKKKIHLIMMEKELKLWTVLRNYTQDIIEKYEKENWTIDINQTTLI